MPTITPLEPDALELLDAEHRALRRLFQDYRTLAAQRAPEMRRKALAEQICLELTIHAKLEDELFYPLVRESVRAGDLMDRAEVEHASLRELVVQILSMDPHEELYDAKVSVLGDYAAHHFGEELDAVFPRVRASGLDLRRLGQRLAERRRELQAVPEALREELLASVLA
ncbi:hemerythrin domain-containing protein [Ramlibacter tataouinensis]|uniref:hemerythrin domain-containing protein n=1 Tax=Ramlibacter tataouinensis TaxID=94132 RepID=UPI0022F3C7E5|nr:hemerythrin domain-containing protein [Ramlibacter tataouinensis]WBY00983.1 hemerythrin domain-containing protein [Ramlibacter tataouinensis]